MPKGIKTKTDVAKAVKPSKAPVTLADEPVKKDIVPELQAEIAGLKMKLDLLTKKSAKQSAALLRMGIKG